MLDKQDKIWLENTIERKIQEALTVEVQYERFDKEKGMKELKVEKEYLPVWWVEYLPGFLGATRGLQEDINKNNNKISKMDTKVSSIGNIFIQLEDSLRCIAALSDHVKQLEIDTPKKVNFIDVEEDK